MLDVDANLFYAWRERRNGERVDRLEQLAQTLAEDRLSLKDDRTSLEEDLVALKQIVAHFATETRRGFDQAAAETRELRAFVRAANEEMRKRFRETGERLREISREGRERERRLDERIDKLVSAVGEMLRTQNPPRQS